MNHVRVKSLNSSGQIVQELDCNRRLILPLRDSMRSKKHVKEELTVEIADVPGPMV